MFHSLLDLVSPSFLCDIRSIATLKRLVEYPYHQGKFEVFQTNLER